MTPLRSSNRTSNMGRPPIQIPGKLTWMAGKWNELEDVFPIENGDFPLPAMLVYRSVIKMFMIHDGVCCPMFPTGYLFQTRSAKHTNHTISQQSLSTWPVPNNMWAINKPTFHPCIPCWLVYIGLPNSRFIAGIRSQVYNPPFKAAKQPGLLIVFCYLIWINHWFPLIRPY